MASPLTIDVAILFLYGKRPNITEDNVSNLMELSEFLMIPNLKAACVRYAKRICITNDNCIRMMELSTLYEFEFSDCFEYVRAHLSDILARNDALNLPKDTLINLLSDPLLTYVTAEERFTFLLKWIKHYPHRESDFIELFDLIDIDDMEPEFMEEQVCKHPILKRLRPNLPSICTKPSNHHGALLFIGLRLHNRTICFDLERHRWYGLHTCLANDPENYFYFSNDSYESVFDNENSDVYEVNYMDENKSETLFIHNLANSEVLESALRSEDANKVCLRNTHVLANDSSQREKLVSVVFGIGKGRSRLKKFTEVLVGELNFPESLLRPAISIPNTHTEFGVANKNNVVALVSLEINTVYLYDIDRGMLDIVKVDNNLEFKSNDKDRFMVCAYKNGFILHNDKKVLSISRLSGPALDNRYLIEKTSLERNSDLWFQIYYFCNGMWYRFEEKRKGDGINFSCISHEVLVYEKEQSHIWKQLSFPQSSIGSLELLRITQLLIVSLPKSKLKCHIDCPHCKTLTSEQNVTTSDSDDSDFSNKE